MRILNYCNVQLGRRVCVPPPLFASMPTPCTDSCPSALSSLRFAHASLCCAPFVIGGVVVVVQPGVGVIENKIMQVSQVEFPSMRLHG